MAVKRYPADIAFSKAIRESYNYDCIAKDYVPQSKREPLESCECNYRHNPGGLDCAHVNSRTHRNTRWCAEYGAVPLCRHHHNFFGVHPILWAEFLTEKFGEDWYDEAKRRAWETRKISKEDQAVIAKHYRQEVKRIELERAEGKEGFIKLRNWDAED